MAAKPARLVLSVSIPGQPDITITDYFTCFIVQYGEQRSSCPTIMHAIAEYESCVVHALTCAGEEL